MPQPKTFICRSLHSKRYPKGVVLACDGQCHKAFGFRGRPSTTLSDDPDDFVYVADQDLPEAPDSLHYEEGKPRCAFDRLNRFCRNECERSEIWQPGELRELPALHQQYYNQPSNHGIEHQHHRFIPVVVIT